MIENIIYIFVIFTILILIKKRHTQFLNNLPLLGFYLFLISFSKFPQLTGDLPNYNIGMQSSSWTFYFQKELFFWLYSRTIYSIVPTAFITFLFLDLSIFVLIFYAFNRNLNIQFVFYLFAFPTVLGFINIYRQLFGVAAMIYFFRKERNDLSTLIILCILTLIHNVFFITVIFFFLYQVKKTLKINVIIFYVLTLCAMPAFYKYLSILENFSGTPISTTNSVLYLISGILMIFFTKDRNCQSKINNSLSFAINCLFLLGSTSVVINPSSTGSRMIMICLSFWLYLYLKNNFHPTRSYYKLTETILVICIFLLPAIILPSIKQLLTQ